MENQPKNQLIAGLCFALILLGSPALFAQIGGISASKLYSLSASSVAESALEFEPSFSVNWAKYAFTSQSDRIALHPNTDSLDFASSAAFRFSYGLTAKTEIGLSLPMDVSSVDLGLKYRWFENEKLGVAAVAGSHLPLGTGSFSYQDQTCERHIAISLGTVFSYQVDRKLSLDFDLQNQWILNENNIHNTDFSVATDIGYYAADGILLIVGNRLQFSNFSARCNNKASYQIAPGISIETAQHFLLVVGMPFTLVGKNCTQDEGVIFALTILFE